MKGAKLTTLHTGRIYPQEVFRVFISAKGQVRPKATVRPEVLRQWKIPVTTPGIEPATFRIVVWCHNQLRYGVPHGL